MTTATSMPKGYAAALRIVHDVVRDWTGPAPLFRFPPQDIALSADLEQVGEHLATNKSARRLLRLLVDRCNTELGHAPTAVMLEAALVHFKIPIVRVSLEELGFEIVPAGPGGGS